MQFLSFGCIGFGRFRHDFQNVGTVDLQFVDGVRKGLQSA